MEFFNILKSLTIILFLFCGLSSGKSSNVDPRYADQNVSSIAISLLKTSARVSAIGKDAFPDSKFVNSTTSMPERSFSTVINSDESIRSIEPSSSLGHSYSFSNLIVTAYSESDSTLDLIQYPTRTSPNSGTIPESSALRDISSRKSLEASIYLASSQHKNSILSNSSPISTSQDPAISALPTSFIHSNEQSSNTETQAPHHLPSSFNSAYFNMSSLTRDTDTGSASKSNGKVESSISSNSGSFSWSHPANSEPRSNASPLSPLETNVSSSTTSIISSTNNIRGSSSLSVSSIAYVSASASYVSTSATSSSGLSRSGVSSSGAPSIPASTSYANSSAASNPATSSSATSSSGISSSGVSTSAVSSIPASATYANSSAASSSGVSSSGVSSSGVSTSAVSSIPASASYANSSAASSSVPSSSGVSTSGASSIPASASYAESSATSSSGISSSGLSTSGVVTSGASSVSPSVSGAYNPSSIPVSSASGTSTPGVSTTGASSVPASVSGANNSSSIPVPSVSRSSTSGVSTSGVSTSGASSVSAFVSARQYRPHSSTPPASNFASVIASGSESALFSTSATVANGSSSVESSVPTTSAPSNPSTMTTSSVTFQIHTSSGTTTQAPIATTSTSGSTTSTTSLNYSAESNFASIMLQAQNDKRALHEDTPPLTWSEDLATYAQDYADQYVCGSDIVHSGGPYGENIAAGTSPVGSVDAWYAEGAYYNYSNPGFSSATSHFTQLIWKSTTEVGCGIKDCSSIGWGDYVICSYNPSGNINAPVFFEENVEPLIGQSSSSSVFSSTETLEASISTSSPSTHSASEDLTSSLSMESHPSSHALSMSYSESFPSIKMENSVSTDNVGSNISGSFNPTTTFPTSTYISSIMNPSQTSISLTRPTSVTSTYNTTRGRRTITLTEYDKTVHISKYEYYTWTGYSIITSYTVSTITPYL
ncbi:uncharacterized protein NDAI_0B00230 [Naumovozyma dairenensis CBS 421]|uniref:SCP domain-containing protein n=1 Tax=Naumovozyma dairenensis (strain ATCC 10597 / BCRC 20456 / CBS 421 / NBRC 0211 / NRRL Y-12639) TaxID=1071378 RepID=G0W5J6_NAUDC|nr:hypothetical protein NDAI_0B00230 [Naumovozyma dairenensis CBS 421]CCD23057.1 hypothetical protein NDAI_0B00230 [Naumovozyma dairenensis CBS 421]